MRRAPGRKGSGAFGVCGGGRRERRNLVSVDEHKFERYNN